MSTLNEKPFYDFVIQVKEKIRKAQYESLKAVNRALLSLYWDLGELIVQKQETHGWGKSVVEELAKELEKEFVTAKGLSAANLWRMRNFYISYKDNPILAPLVREIGWSHNLAIFEKCKDPLEREFYIRMTIKYGWTKNVLIHHIENRSYEKYLLNQTNFDQAVPEKYRLQAKMAVKDEYTFDFLEMDDDHSEAELEQALVKNIRAFLIEMGGDFAFIGNQFRLSVGTKDYSIDLLLFHRRLRCLIAVELKIGDFQPEYQGKMEFYLTALNEQFKLPDENDSIGIIICKSKDKTVVEYALKTGSRPIGVSTYTLTSRLPDRFAGLLPTQEEIQERLGSL
jgi:predicted nuclease of restriction endonuclease-like (RecB) superfamily